MPSWAYVVEKWTGGITAPVAASASCPAWTARLANPRAASVVIGVLLFVGISVSVRVAKPRASSHASSYSLLR